MSKNNESTPTTGKIDPQKKLPEFLSILSDQTLHPYDGETHGCIANHEVAVAINAKPGLFYGIPKWLVIWGES